MADAIVAHIRKNIFDVYGGHNLSDDYKHIERIYNAALYGPGVASAALLKVALCHDVVEDSLATYKDLTSWGLTFEEVCAITLLNRNDDTPKLPYLSYIQKIIDEYHEGTPGADLAIDVKILDILDHLHPFHVRNVREKKLPLYVGGLSMLIQARRAS